MDTFRGNGAISGHAAFVQLQKSLDEDILAAQRLHHEKFGMRRYTWGVGRLDYRYISHGKKCQVSTSKERGGAGNEDCTMIIRALA